jgi:hypothetical protein
MLVPTGGCVVAVAAQPGLGAAATTAEAGGDELEGEELEGDELEGEELGSDAGAVEAPGALDPPQEEMSSPRTAVDTNTSRPRALDRHLTAHAVVPCTWLLPSFLYVRFASPRHDLRDLGHPARRTRVPSCSHKSDPASPGNDLALAGQGRVGRVVVASARRRNRRNRVEASDALNAIPTHVHQR